MKDQPTCIIWCLYIFHLTKISCSQPSLDFSNIFSECSKQDIIKKVLPQAAREDGNFHIQCQIPRWISRTDYASCLGSTETRLHPISNRLMPICYDKDDESKYYFRNDIHQRCFLRCKSGYSIQSPDNHDSRPEQGVFSCVKLRGKNHNLFYWRYSDGSPGKKDDFSSCAVDPCWTPKTLLSYPRAKAAYKWRWMDGSKKLSQTPDSNSEGPVNTFTGRLYLNLWRIMTEIDQLKDGFTIILSMNQKLNGTFFVSRSLKWNGHQDGKTFSFSSTYWNRGHIGADFYSENGNHDVPVWKLKNGKSQGNHRTFFDVSFWALPGEFLPADYTVESVRIIEGEYENTECLSNKMLFQGYLRYNISSRNYYYGSKENLFNVVDLDSFVRNSHRFNPIGDGCDKSRLQIDEFQMTSIP